MAAMVGASTGSFTASTDALGASTGTFGVPTGGAFFDEPSETMHQLAWSEADGPPPPDEREEFLFGVDRIIDGFQALIDPGA